MPVPYSNDLRKRIIDAKLKGIPETQIAAAKDVHKSTVRNFGLFIEKQAVMNLVQILTAGSPFCPLNNGKMLKTLLLSAPTLPCRN